jgi:thioredoxin 1
MELFKNPFIIRQYSVLVSIIALSLFACNKSKPASNTKAENKQVSQSQNQPVPQAKKEPADQSKKEAIPLISSMDDLKKLIDTSGNKLLVFDLYADWCMPCRALSPTLTALASANTKNALFFRINVDKSRDIAAEFGVNGIPYVVFVKNKEAIYAITGLNPREKYEKVIASCGTSQTAAACKGKLQEAYY